MEQKIKKTRGRPLGYSGKYLNDEGKPIGVIEWRRKYKKSQNKNTLEDFLEEIRKITGLTGNKFDNFIIFAIKNQIKLQLTQKL